MGQNYPSRNVIDPRTQFVHRSDENKEGMGNYLVILHDAKDTSENGRRALAERLAEEHKLSPEILVSAFSNLPVIVRKNLPEEEASEYCRRLESYGAIAEALEEVASSTLAINELQPQLVDFSASSDPNELSFDLQADSCPTLDSLNSLESTLDELLGEDELLDDFDLTLPPTEEAVEAPASSDELSDFSFDLGSSPDSEEELVSEPEEALLEEHEIEEDEDPRIDPTLLVENAFAPPTPPPPEAVEIPDNGTSQTGGMVADPIDPAQLQIADQAPIKKRAFKRPSKQVLLFIIAGLCCYAVAGYLGSTFGRKEPVITINFKALLRQQRAILGGAGDSSKNNKPTVHRVEHWSARTNAEEYNGELNFITINGKIQRADIEIRIDEPKKRTIKEILDGKEEMGWMRLFSVKNTPLTSIEDEQKTLADGEFHLRGVGRAYLRDSQGFERVVADIVFRGKLDSNSDEISGTWKISYGKKSYSEDSPNVVRRLEDDHFSVFYRGDFSGRLAKKKNETSTK